jgi:hypothetical protein
MAYHSFLNSLKKASSTSYVLTSLTPMLCSANLFTKSSPSIKSICCFPEALASSLACFENRPVVMKSPFSILVVNDPLKSLISGAPTIPEEKDKPKCCCLAYK